MGISMLRATGRLFVPVAAVVLLAGVSLEAGAYGSKGSIKLLLNQPGMSDGFYYYDGTNGVPEGQLFNLPKSTKCEVTEEKWTYYPSGSSGAPKLVSVQATGPTGSQDPSVGLIDGMLGVYDGSKGTSCGRMTAGYGEKLTFTSLKGGFDRLEFDMELKGNAVFKLTVDPELPNPDDRAYFLYSGTSQSSTAKLLNVYGLPAATPLDRARNCQGSSDSGPDSGTNDNCRWVIEAVGSSFRLEPTVGEGSLEGGGDYVGTPLLPGQKTETIIYLTSLIDVGTLGCEPDNNKTAKVFAPPGSEGAAECQVTRIAPPGTDPADCDLIQYRLETFSADSLCRLDKTGTIDSNGDGRVEEQLVGSLAAKFQPEDKPADWYGIEPTVIQFVTDEDFLGYRCGGTVFTDGEGNRTIEEVLKNPGLKGVIVNDQFVARPPITINGQTEETFYLDGTNDALRTNGSLIDWACILDTKDVYQGGEKIQVEQTIPFWGDIAWSRTGPQS